MPTPTLETSTALPATAPGTPAPPFGVNAMRLTGRQWLVTIAIVLVCALVVPRVWKKFEPFPTGPDYRIPYALSKDYWLYERRLQQDAASDKVVILGDSVVWGEYVRPAGTLSHYFDQETAQPGRFLNGGVNGLFPLALEGLVDNYASELHDRKIIVHFNLLWLTSPKADLSTEKEELFNHSRLVPQFTPKIPCYRADANERLSAVLDRHVGFFAWANHLQNAYYDQRTIPQWTLEQDDSDPPKCPNAWRNPLAPLKSGIPGEPADDPQRGPISPRHKPWNAGGAEPTDFDWVDLDASLQWKAFERVTDLLRARGNDVLIVIGPFNEHMIATDQQPQFRALRDAAAGRLAQKQMSVIVPDVLPSDLYADASHPLTEGYARLAKEIAAQKMFQQWLAGKGLR
jgi:hypothetical protein